MSEHSDSVLQDWGELVAFEPTRVLRPSGIDELKAMLEEVHRDGGRVRVPGSLHSCSEIVVNDVLLDVSGLPKSIELEDGNEAVTATANVSLDEFLAELGRHGRSVTATGGTNHQTLAGLISTGTAPASSRHGLYEKLEWVELVSVDAEGQAFERRISRQDPEFAAAICSLGLLGVLTRVHFRVVDELYFDVVMKVVELDEVLDDLDATSAKYDFWRVNWMQKSDKALLWAATAVPRESSEPDGDYPTEPAEHVLDWVLQAMDKIADTGPLLNPVLEGVYRVMAFAYGENRFTGPLRNMLPVDRRAPLRVAMAEWSFRPQDLQRVLDECREYFGEAGWPNIPTEIELTRVDGALMSPWSWEGLDYVVKFNWMYLTEVCRSPGEKEQIHAHLRGLWEHLRRKEIPFKAHWGKVNFIDPAFVRENHDFEAFRPLIAPIFVNDYLAERIGPLEDQP
ncbi:MAG TPA: FAD-binding protein [Solirubrobacterales bacterium]